MQLTKKAASAAFFYGTGEDTRGNTQKYPSKNTLTSGSITEGRGYKPRQR